MKLQFDQNLSFKLVTSVTSAFPGSKHIRDFGLTQEDDQSIWTFAAENDFTIIPKDSDFMHRALLRGHPPKFIHLRVGNCPTDRIERLIESKRSVIMDLTTHLSLCLSLSSTTGRPNNRLQHIC